VKSDPFAMPASRAMAAVGALNPLLDDHSDRVVYQNSIARDRGRPGATAVGYRLPTVTSAAPLQFLILLVASWIGRRQGEAIEYLRAENSVLRARLGHKRLRFAEAERRLLAQKGKPLGRKLLAEMATLATPETILRWYRERVAAKYDGSRTRGRPGRPAIRGDKVKQLLTMARENPSWGYTRLRGALENLGFDLGRSTIQRILTEQGGCDPDQAAVRTSFRCAAA
jgi:hypothetical protein